MLQHEPLSHATDMDRRSVILRSALASAFGCMYNPLPALALDTPTLASFPGALPSMETEAAVYKALSARGYNNGGTAWSKRALARSSPCGRPAARGAEPQPRGPAPALGGSTSPGGSTRPGAEPQPWGAAPAQGGSTSPGGSTRPGAEPPALGGSTSPGGSTRPGGSTSPGAAGLFGGSTRPGAAGLLKRLVLRAALWAREEARPRRLGAGESLSGCGVALLPAS